MNLFHLTNMAQTKSMSLTKKVLNRGNFLKSQLKICDLLGGWKLATNAKLQHHIS